MSRFKAPSMLPVFLAVAVLVVVAGALWAQPGAGAGGAGRGGRAGGGMQGMILIDRMWTAICFGVKANPEQLTKLTPDFQAAWDARAEALKQAAATQNPDAAMQAMKQIRENLDAKVKEVLTPEQLTQLQALLQVGQGQGRGQGRGQRGGQGGGQAAAQ